jgi:hypothetical protein
MGSPILPKEVEERFRGALRGKLTLAAPALAGEPAAEGVLRGYPHAQPGAQQEAVLAPQEVEQQEAAPDMSREIEFLAQNVFSEIERDDPEGGVYSWDEGDRERVRAYISARFKPGMSGAEAAALQEGAAEDLLQALEFEQAEMSEGEVNNFLAALTDEVAALGEVITAIKRKRNL